MFTENTFRGNNENIFNMKLELEKLFLIIASAIILIIHFLTMKDRNMISVFDDEWGYLSSAAYLAGYDWSEITSTTFFYAQGYSFMIAPIFKLVKNPYITYKLILALNAILMSTIPFVVHDVCARLFPDMRKCFKVTISILVALYPTYIIYVSFAMAECLLTYLQWIIIWIFSKLTKNKSLFWTEVLGGLTGYCVIVHQRMLGVMLAVVIAIGMMYFAKKITLKQTISFGVVLLLTMCAQNNIKQYFINNLWLNGANIVFNNFEGNMDKIWKIFTYDGFKDTIKVFLGQMYYSGIATYMLLIIGLISLICYSVKIIRNAIVKKDEVEQREMVYLYILISYLGNASVSAIFMNSPTSLKHILYGRYNEIVALPVVICGIYFLMKQEIKLWQKAGLFICSLSVFLFSFYVSFRYIITFAAQNQNFLTIKSIAAFTGINMYYNVELFEIDIPLATVCTVGLAGLFFVGLVLRTKSMIPKLTVLLCVCGLSLISSFKFSGEFAGLRKNDDILAGHMQCFKDYVYAIETDYDKEALQDSMPAVYAALRKSGNSFKYYLQYIFYDQKILRVDIEDINKIASGSYVITYRDSDISEDIFDLELQKGSYFLWKKK